MIGWLMMGGGMLLLAAILLSGVVGGGSRRTSRKAALAAAGEENRRLRERITELQAQINPIPSLEEIAAADLAYTGPKFHQDAPAFLPGAQPRTPDPAPVDDEHLLTQLVAQDPEATQSLGVTALRAAAQMDAGTTVTLPAVTAVEPVPPVTWGVTATKPLWKVHADQGSSKPEEVSPATAKLAVVNVAQHLDEAS